MEMQDHTMTKLPCGAQSAYGAVSMPRKVSGQNGSMDAACGQQEQNIKVHNVVLKEGVVIRR